MRILKPRKSIFGIAKTVPENVRIRAAWALRNFKHSSEVDDVLEHASNDESYTLSQTAKESLSELRENKN